MRDAGFILLGYLLGGVLFARVFGALLSKGDIAAGTPDENPGTVNAFHNGGFFCGLLTLCGDVLKGYLPVSLYLRQTPTRALALVLAAPVLGHIFPPFHRLHGGKGIAATFGCLLALAPNFRPLLLLAAFFIFYSTLLRVSTDYHKTLFTYPCTLAAIALLEPDRSITLGFLIITAAVCVRLFTSKEEKPRCEIKPLWMR